MAPMGSARYHIQRTTPNPLPQAAFIARKFLGDLDIPGLHLLSFEFLDPFTSKAEQQLSKGVTMSLSAAKRPSGQPRVELKNQHADIPIAFIYVFQLDGQRESLLRGGCSLS